MCGDGLGRRVLVIGGALCRVDVSHFEDEYLEEDLVFKGDASRRYVRRLKGRRCGVSSLGVEC
jgi:hypothetical protein